MPKTSAGIRLHRLGPTDRPGGADRTHGRAVLGPQGRRGLRKDPAAPRHSHARGGPLQRGRPAREDEHGSPLPAVDLVPLGQLRVSGKVLTVWAAEGDLDADACISNTFEIEWPPRSGRVQQFPEIDRAAWFAIDAARTKLVKGQVPFLDRSLDVVGGT